MFIAYRACLCQSFISLPLRAGGEIHAPNGPKAAHWKAENQHGRSLNVRAIDAKEVGVGNPAEETFYHSDTISMG